jgi:hypothetical protein
MSSIAIVKTVRTKDCSDEEVEGIVGAWTKTFKADFEGMSEKGWIKVSVFLLGDEKEVLLRNVEELLKRKASSVWCERLVMYWRILSQFNIYVSSGRSELVLQCKDR